MEIICGRWHLEVTNVTRRSRHVRERFASVRCSKARRRPVLSRPAAGRSLGLAPVLAGGPAACGTLLAGVSVSWQIMDQSRASPNADLERRAIRGTLLFIVALWLLIFLPAGTLAYWQGWLFWAQFSIWSAAGAWYFLKRDPALVQRRLRAGPA